MTGNLSMGTHFLQDVVDPVRPQDAAMKSYVDSRLGGSSETLLMCVAKGTHTAGLYECSWELGNAPC